MAKRKTVNFSDAIDLLRESLVDPSQSRTTLRDRKSPYFKCSVRHALVPDYVENGWVIAAELKTKTKLCKPKSSDVVLEDRVWSLLAQLGFHTLNRDRRLAVPYSASDPKLTQQIDVFAADDEVVLVVECKASKSGPAKSSFKKDIEALGGRKQGLIPNIRKLTQNPQAKVVFVFATYDYYLSEVDKERLENFGIHHFDNEMLEYYDELQKHLGTAARYQLEANLFPGQSIPAIENTVPALQGKMGGHTYFAFMIDPATLLKLGYVLHRSKANKKLMPTYQRLIKKSRLANIRKFVEGGGFFPNSLIANIDAKRSPKFEVASSSYKSKHSRAGILHLPNTYRSLFVIDGQHRLYAYSDSKYSESTTVPVVAFVNLDRSEQVRVFMEINENQKAVPKNLRHTLNADLHWDSENNIHRVNALKLQIAQDLGEDLASPFYDRIIVGENVRSTRRVVTLDAVKQGLDRSNFFGEFTASGIKSDGTFYKGSNDDTNKKLYPFLVAAFSYIREICPEEWEKDSSTDGLMVINVGVNSLIRLLSDIVDHVILKRRVNPKAVKTERVLTACKPYLDPLLHFFDELTVDERTKIKRAYGSSGPTRFWRILQREVSEARADFRPEGLEEFWRDESHQFNTEAFELVRGIEEFLNADFKELLKEKYGKSWFKVGVHPTVYKEASAQAAEKNRVILEGEEEKEPWDCLHIVDYRTIAMYSDNWSTVFEERFTRPGEEKIRGGKEEKTKWFVRLNTIRNQNFHEYSVKEDELKFLQEVDEWLHNLE